MLNNVKAMILEKQECLETAKILFEDVTQGGLDDLIILNEASDLPKEDEEEIQNQQLMDIAMNNLNKLLKKITEDYVNKDYTRNSENNEEYQKLITAMADIRILEGGVQIPNLDRMNEGLFLNFH